MSSLDYLRKRSDYLCQLKFHPAVKRILHLRNHSASWEPVVSDKLIESNSSASSSDSFDRIDPEKQFTYLGCTKVVLLEVKSEEFAPIKMPVGPGVADTAATACALLLALHQQVGSLTPVENVTKESSLLKAYAGGVPYMPSLMMVFLWPRNDTEYHPFICH